jgi:hypothetical protein
MTFEPCLKTGLMVSAEIRRCENLLLNVVIMFKGDEDRGQMIIKQYVHGEGARLYAQTRDMDDHLIWHQPLGDGFMGETKADDYIKRQREFDEDLWVLEVDDPKDIYSLEI